MGNNQPKTAKEVLDELGAKWSPDFDDYASGRISNPRCVLCTHSPCDCPEFGTPEYIAMLDQRHGR